MNRMTEEENPLPEMSELKLYVSDGASAKKGAKLKADVRFGIGEFEAGKTVFSLSVLRAFLSLDMIGLEIEAGTRSYEGGKEHAPTQKRVVVVEDKSKTKMGGQIGGGVDPTLVPFVKGKAEASRTVEHSRSEKTTTSGAAIHQNIIARGGSRWEFKDKSPLQKTYVNNEPLCTLKATVGANAHIVEAELQVYARDLKVDIIRGGLFSSINTERLIAIAMSKAVSRQGKEYSGKVTLSKCVLEVNE